MKVTHTPGKWYVHDEYTSAEGVFPAEIKVMSTIGGRTLIADLGGSLIGHSSDSYAVEVKANAKLISAAPDLFDALLPFTELKGRSVNELNDMMNKAKAAIKKARGL